MRNIFVFKLVLVVGLVNVAGLSSTPAGPDKTNLTMGGKRNSGPCFQTTGTISKSVNWPHNKHGIRIPDKSRRDPVSILTAVMSGDFKCGALGMSRIGQVVKSLAEWKGRPQRALRNVHAEQIGLVTKI
jgi:hypothetical protein